MNNMKDDLIKLVTISYKEQKGYIASLTDKERSAGGRVDDWSPKDHLAHVAHWDLVMAGDLADLEQGGSDGGSVDFDEQNAEVWEKYKGASWNDIGELVDKAHEDLVKNLQGLTEEELTDPERFEWSSGRAVWRSVNFSSFYHTLQHVAVLYAARGDIAYANRIQQDAAELQMELEDDEEWRGTVLYNLGCHYAITRQRQSALDNIRKGLELNPSLKEWAPKDPDLKIYSDDPEFQALLS